MAGPACPTMQPLHQNSMFRLEPPSRLRSDPHLLEHSLGAFQAGGNVYSRPAQQYAVPPQLDQHSARRAASRTNYAQGTQESEHSLRRKTPWGTLTAGYDGTPVDKTSRRHPTKHVVLPTDPTLKDSKRQTQQSTSVRTIQLQNWPFADSGSRPSSLSFGSSFTSFDRTPSASNYPCNSSHTVDTSLQGNPSIFGQFQYPVVGNQVAANVMPPAAPTQLGPTVSHGIVPFMPYDRSGVFEACQSRALHNQARVDSQSFHEPSVFAQTHDHRVAPQYVGSGFPHNLQNVPLQYGSASGNACGSLKQSGYSRPHSLQDFGPLKEALGTYREQPRDHFGPDLQGVKASHVKLSSSELSQWNVAGYTGHRESKCSPTPARSSAESPSTTLAWAHSAYAGLVTSIQASRKSSQHFHHGFDTYGNASRLHIFPKPYRTLPGDTNANHAWATSSVHDVHWNRSHHYSPIATNTAPVPSSNKFRLNGGSKSKSQYWPSHLATQHPLERQKQLQKQHLMENLPSNLMNDNMHHGGRMADHCTRPDANHWMNHVDPVWTDMSNAQIRASEAFDVLTHLSWNSNFHWVEGMLLAGCLAYAIGDLHAAEQWFSKTISRDPSHTEAVSNLAITYLAQRRRHEAEKYWQLAIKIQPTYLEAAEHLLTMLTADHRQREAVELIDYIQRLLRLDCRHENTPKPDQREALPERASFASRVAFNAGLDRSSIAAGGSDFHSVQGEKSASHPQSTCYAIADADVGRLIALVNAKANLLYNLHDQNGAAKAFEEVVLIAINKGSGSVDQLINTILKVLRRSESSCSYHAQTADNALTDHDLDDPLFLTPNKALHTASLCFPPFGGLPGISLIRNKAYEKNAIGLTASSLLSLAKIYQDGMASSASLSDFSRPHRGVREILALYYLSMSLHPAPSTANNVGILFAGLPHASQPKPKAHNPSNEEIMFPGVVPGSGIALALKYYQYGLNLDSAHPHLFTNLGSLLKDIGQLSMAIKMYEKAVECDGSFDIALANLASAVKDQGKTAQAITYYRRAVQVNPNFAEAVCGLSNSLTSVCQWVGRGGVVDDRGLDRWHVDDSGRLLDSTCPATTSSGWIKRVIDIVNTQLAEGQKWGLGYLSARYMERVSAQIALHHMDPRTFQSCVQNLLTSWAGQKWEGARLLRLIERATRRIGWTWYHDKYLRRREKARSAYARPVLPETLAVPGAPTVLPFHTFTLPMSAKQIRLVSQRNGIRVSCSTLRSSWLPSTVYTPPPPPSPHLNIGYVSSDFNNHPLAHLMQSVFGMHDSRRYQSFCYATTASDNSVHRRQIEEEATVFHDSSSWSMERLVQQIVEDNIHILVNLNGYTRGARNEVFAARPAPVQMSFMGFAGTMGAEWCDYLLADEIAIPNKMLRPWRRNVDFDDLCRDENNSNADDDWVYGENIIYTRDTFFCCDHKQGAEPGDKHMSWDQEQARRWKMRKQLFPTLSDNAIILGNFNQLYKIDPTTFRTWLRILSRVPDAVLWLLRFPDQGETHLRETALAWAGHSIASRIIFTDVAPKSQHIMRACIADIFLDTPECNAHTTAADCLWSGTPLLTLPRYAWKMCSRMAASILGGALPRDTREGQEAWRELVAGSEQEYEDAAVRLASGIKYLAGGEGKAEGRLMELRKIIWSHRWQSKLFDTRRWVRDLELAYEEAWRRWVAGEGGDIWLKDL